MSQRVPAALRRLVQARAHCRCEYCLIHEGDVHFPHQPDHVIAQKHRGPTHEDNLAWACYLCNLLKGSDIASVDMETGQIVRLFNPRLDHWPEHFRLQDGLHRGTWKSMLGGRVNADRMSPSAVPRQRNDSIPGRVGLIFRECACRADGQKNRGVQMVAGH